MQVHLYGANIVPCLHNAYLNADYGDSEGDQKGINWRVYQASKIISCLR